MRRIVTTVGMLGVLLLASAAQAAEGPVKIAVLDIRAKGTVDQAQVEGLSSLIASEVTALGRYTVVTSGDMKEMLGFEAQQQLLGCTEGTSCLAEIGGALGVDRLLSTEVSQVGSTWLLTLVLLDIGEAKATARLTRKTTEEGLVDASGEMVREILRPAGGAPGGEAATQATPGEGSGTDEAEGTGATAETTEGGPDTRPPARAAKPGALHLDLGLGTQLPLGVGLRAQLELPGRVQVALGFLIVPNPYARFIAKMSLPSDAEGARFEMLQAMHKNRGLLQLSAGWRPLATQGLEVLAGYTLIAGGYNKITVRQILDGYGDDIFDLYDLPGLPPRVEELEQDVAGRGHALHLEVAWRFDLGGLYLRPRAGFLGVFDSDPDLNAQPEIINGSDWDKDVEDQLQDDFARSKAFHLGLTVGYRIF